MAERATNAAGDGEQPTGEAREARSASAVLDDPETLRGRAAAAERQRDEYRDQLLRTRADFENYQNRARRDTAEERRFAHAPFARELLRILDNLRRALAAADQQSETGPLVEGVVLVQSDLNDVFGRFGITPIDAQGRPFDPNAHEAVVQRARADVPAGTVVEVLEPGYRLHERVLRPARVAVAAPPAPGP